MKIFLLIFLMTGNCMASTFDNFMADEKITHKTLGKTELPKSIKVSSGQGFHYLFTFNDNEKGLYDIDFQTGVEPATGENTIKNLTNILKMSYGDKPSPYSGEITNVEKCPADFAPKLVTEKIGSREYKYYMSSAGARYQYGVCEKETAVYSVCTLNYYVKEKKILAKVKYFIPLEKNGNCKKGLQTFIKGLNL